jgi:ADP-heptose:LPS heptosyltransferase
MNKNTMHTSKKIILIHFYSNGDCLYATAVARQIKQDFQNCHLSWAIASNCKSIIANNPYIDEIIVVDYVHRNDTEVMNQLKAKINLMDYDHVFITHPSYIENMALYDGCIRSNVLNAYPYPITVPITPVLQLTNEEISNVEAFAKEHRLGTYKNVILFEFAPQSGQLNITTEAAVAMAEDMVSMKDIAVILSSAKKIEHSNTAIIDGSILTLRETAALTHYCHLLVGCSSGITWISTSSAAKLLPMIQLLNPFTTWVNPISRDFERYNLPLENVIELFDFDNKKLVQCIEEGLSNFKAARSKYNQKVPLHFKTSRKIVYELWCRLKFKAILKHIKVNKKVYGNNLSFYKECLAGIVFSPFIFMHNRFRKFRT